MFHVVFFVFWRLNTGLLFSLFPAIKLLLSPPTYANLSSSFRPVVVQAVTPLLTADRGCMVLLQEWLRF